MMQSDEPMDQGEFVFPQGIAGFEVAHRFGFIYEGVGDMVCMQSLDQPEAAFILTPWDEERLGKPPTLTAEHINCLEMDGEASDAEDLMWMLVLNPFADKTWVTANVRAPIALNLSAHRGVQYIRHASDLPLRFQWMEQPKVDSDSA